MIRIRDMEIADVDQVCQLEESAFSMPWKKHDFLDMIESEHAMYFVAEDQEKPGEILACSGVRNIAMEGDISNVVVREDMRSRGIGKKILLYLMEKSNEIWGMTSFTLEVRAGNQPAIKLYEGLGFVTEGLRKNFYEKPTEDALIMWKR